VMKPLTIIPTVVVALAVAAMIALGVWQLQRAQWKERLLARYEINLKLLPTTFPKTGPVPEDAMFRTSQVNCLRVTEWRTEGGRTANGQSGYRHIAACMTGAEGQGALVDLGVAKDPKFKPTWTGGIVDGRITTEPNHASLIAGLFGNAPVLRPMLVADRPAPGLIASAPPRTDDVPNNHRAYAVQWFIFAGIALAIYLIALRRRVFP
jgi:surfeit locus 1 family protein